MQPLMAVKMECGSSDVAGGLILPPALARGIERDGIKNANEMG
jgi:hypothetical protein